MKFLYSSHSENIYNINTSLPTTHQQNTPFEVGEEPRLESRLNEGVKPTTNMIIRLSLTGGSIDMLTDNRATVRSTDPNEPMMSRSDNMKLPSFIKNRNINIISSLFKIHYKKKF